MVYTMSATVLFLLFIAALVSGENHSKTDIPCNTESDCALNSKTNVQSACVDNHCEFAANPPKTMRMVTALYTKCHFDEECNIDMSICDDNLCTCSNGTVASFSRRKCITEAKKIGDACEEDIQCNFPETTCRAGKCDCEPGFGLSAENDTVCYELNGIGNSCNKDADCEVEHTKCIANTTCDCADGYSAYKKECYEISVSYLSKCDIDYQCQRTLGPDAICIKQVCHCQAKHIFSLLENRCIYPVFKHIANHGIPARGNAFYLLPWISALSILRVSY